ncbi:MAG: hypothetical protein KatS3mg111_2801 [Pirellulaceae bacterium]|nr:MAG: hypothetical protein KatS3mg111_2801 [Pirellulaceae bacterium]
MDSSSCGAICAVRVPGALSSASTRWEAKINVGRMHPAHANRTFMVSILHEGRFVVLGVSIAYPLTILKRNASRECHRPGGGPHRHFYLAAGPVPQWVIRRRRSSIEHRNSMASKSTSTCSGPVKHKGRNVGFNSIAPIEMAVPCSWTRPFAGRQHRVSMATGLRLGDFSQHERRAVPVVGPRFPKMPFHSCSLACLQQPLTNHVQACAFGDLVSVHIGHVEDVDHLVEMGTDLG